MDQRMTGGDRRRPNGAGRSGRTARATPAGPVAGRADVAAYIGRLASELVELARAAEFRTLAYLADMVRLEAEQQVLMIGTRETGPAGPDQRRATRPPESR